MSKCTSLGTVCALIAFATSTPVQQASAAIVNSSISNLYFGDSDPAQVNIDGDLTTDFVFYNYFSFEGNLANDQFLVDSNSGQLLTYNFGDTISLTDSSYQYANGSDFEGTYYLGFKFRNSAGRHVGWMQVDNDTQTIISAAYNDSVAPNATITVGAQAVPEPGTTGILMSILPLAILAYWKARKAQPLES